MVGFERNSIAVQYSDHDYIIAGATSGFITRTLFQPLDVIKIRFQLQIEPIGRKSVQSKYKGTVQAFQSIIKEETFFALWKGFIPAQLLSISYGALQFLAYEVLTSAANKNISQSSLTKPVMNFTCGALAGFAATAGSFPFDVLRTRLVAQGEPKTYKSMSHAATKMLVHEGLPSFYKGFLPTLIQIMPNAGAQFAFYQLFQEFWKLTFKTGNSMSTAVQSGFCGAAAGIAAKTCVYPLDLIKKRFQVHGFENARRAFGSVRTYSGLLQCAATIVREESVLGLYKGLWPSVIKAAATTGSHFLFYEQTLRFLSFVRS